MFDLLIFYPDNEILKIDFIIKDNKGILLGIMITAWVILIIILIVLIYINVKIFMKNNKVHLEREKMKSMRTEKPL